MPSAKAVDFNLSDNRDSAGSRFGPRSLAPRWPAFGSVSPSLPHFLPCPFCHAICQIIRTHLRAMTLSHTSRMQPISALLSAPVSPVAQSRRALPVLPAMSSPGAQRGSAGNPHRHGPAPSGQATSLEFPIQPRPASHYHHAVGMQCSTPPRAPHNGFQAAEHIYSTSVALPSAPHAPRTVATTIAPATSMRTDAVVDMPVTTRRQAAHQATQETSHLSTPASNSYGAALVSSSQVTATTTSSSATANAIGAPKRSRGTGPTMAGRRIAKRLGVSTYAGLPTPAPQKKVRSSKSNIPGTSRYWTPSEHKLFVQALLKYGPKDLKSIAKFVGTRNMIQCRTHEQKCFMRLMREAQRETELRAAAQAAAEAHDEGEDEVMETGESVSSAYLAGGRGPEAGVCSATSSISSDVPEKLEGKATSGKKAAAASGASKQPKDVYSVPPSCGITLLCVVGEEMSRALSI